MVENRQNNNVVVINLNYSYRIYFKNRPIISQFNTRYYGDLHLSKSSIDTSDVIISY